MKKKDKPTISEQCARLTGLVSRYTLQLMKLREECEHTFSTFKYGSNTGGYDSIDTYWTDHICDDCGKRWRIDQ